MNRVTPSLLEEGAGIPWSSEFGREVFFWLMVNPVVQKGNFPVKKARAVPERVQAWTLAPAEKISPHPTAGVAVRWIGQGRFSAICCPIEPTPDDPDPWASGLLPSVCLKQAIDKQTSDSSVGGSVGHFVVTTKADT